MVAKLDSSGKTRPTYSRSARHVCAPFVATRGDAPPSLSLQPLLCYIYIVSLLIVFVVQSPVVDTPVRNNVSAQFSQPSRPHLEVRGTQQLVPRVCFMNMSVLRILCATYVVPFLTPFVVSLRSLMNIAGEATMNQLLWNRRRALRFWFRFRV